MRLLMWFQTRQASALVPLARQPLPRDDERDRRSAWLLLEGAVIALEKKKSVAAGHPDAAFYEGKVAAALYFARNVLPGVELKAKLMARRGQDADRDPRRGVRDGLTRSSSVRRQRRARFALSSALPDGWGVPAGSCDEDVPGTWSA